MLVKTITIFIVTLSFCVNIAFSQIKVIVLDNDELPIEFAESQLTLFPSNSNFFGVSDSNGLIVFQGINSGQYEMVIQYFGFNTDTIRNIRYERGKMMDLGIHQMSVNARILDELVVKAERPKTIIKPNGEREINIEGSTLSTGETGLSILSALSGVTTSSSEGIKVRGKGNVLIKINGKTQYLDQQELNAYLETIPSDNIQKIVVTPTTTSSSDATGSGSAINIVTKKNTYSGFSGRVWTKYRYSRYSSVFPGASLNWKYKKLSGSIYYRHSYYQGFHDIGINRKVANLGNGYFNETVDEKWTYVGHIPRIALNYDIHQKHSISLGAELVNVKNDFTTDYYTEISDDGNRPDSIVTSNIQTRTKQFFPSIDVNYHFEIKDDEHELDFNYGFFYFDYSKDSKLWNEGTNPLTMESTPRSEATEFSPLTNPLHSASIDYKGALKREHFIDLGVKTTIFTKDNSTIRSNLVNGEYVTDPENDNSFEYGENIFAGYVNWGKKFYGWTTNIGMRVEHTSISKANLTEGTKSDTSYIDFFPSISFNKKFDKDISFFAGYARRIYRPRFLELNPFEIELSPFLFTSGNPDLRPQINNIVDFDVTFKGKYSVFAIITMRKDLLIII